MQLSKLVQNGLIGATALVFVGSHIIPGADQPGPVLAAATAFLAGTSSAASDENEAAAAVAAATNIALGSLSGPVRTLSHPKALETAFRSYFAYKATHQDEVKKSLLYFVDYGLPSTTPRGYLFDMQALEIVDGPFTVAHGRGSSTSRYGVPTRFSNVSGSEATSLGLYLAKDTYDFHGKTAGRSYRSIGLRLLGLSSGYNDKAGARGVVAHGAPYVTANKAGRSEGCPAMEPTRAERLLPQLAGGGMVFLFAPDPDWMSHDPQVVTSTE